MYFFSTVFLYVLLSSKHMVACISQATQQNAREYIIKFECNMQTEDYLNCRLPVENTQWLIIRQFGTLDTP